MDKVKFSPKSFQLKIKNNIQFPHFFLKRKEINIFEPWL